MTISFKPVAIAVLSAIGSAAAMAAPPPSAITVPTTSLPDASNNGNLMLFVWDSSSTNQKSVVYDLGLKINQIQIPDMTVAGTSITFSGISLGAISATPGSTVRYMVAAADAESIFGAPTGYNLYTTGVNLLTTPDNAGGRSEVSGSADLIAGYQINIFNDVDNGGCAGVNGCAATTQATTGGDPRLFGGQSFAANLNYPQTLAFDPTAGRRTWTSVGTALDFFALNFGDSSNTLTKSQYTGGSWLLAANGTLTYTVAGVSEVPVPAAIWLFGSGLMGLGTISRRRRAASAVKTA